VKTIETELVKSLSVCSTSPSLKAKRFARDPLLLFLTGDKSQEDWWDNLIILEQQANELAMLLVQRTMCWNYLIEQTHS